MLRRLAKEDGGEPIINVAQTFGGGKSHTLTTLYYLTTLGAKLPRKATAVEHIMAEAKLENPPAAVVASVSFDWVDWKKGGKAKAPDGTERFFRMPWNLIAWQLLGQQGLDILGRDESQPDYDTPPATPLWVEVLTEVEKTGKGALILVDEFLMWAHTAATPDPDPANKRQRAGLDSTTDATFSNAWRRRWMARNDHAWWRPCWRPSRRRTMKRARPSWMRATRD